MCVCAATYHDDANECMTINENNDNYDPDLLIMNHHQSIYDKNDSKCPYDATILTVSQHSAGLDMDGKVYSNFIQSKHVHWNDEILIYGGTTNYDATKLQILVDLGICPPHRMRIYLENTPSHEKDASFVKKFNQESFLQDHNDRLIFMVNPELLRMHCLIEPGLELLMCKTHACVDYLKVARTEAIEKGFLKSSIPIWYTGFTTIVETNEDISTLDFDKFLHPAGKSPYKGTTQLLMAWYNNPKWPKLAFHFYDNKLVSYISEHLFNDKGFKHMPANIAKHEEKIHFEEFDRILKTHGVHVVPSDVEGFGHAINEARAVGALVVTTNYPAMNEFFQIPDSGILVEPSRIVDMDIPSFENKMRVAIVSKETVEVAINHVLNMSIEERRIMGQRARKGFEKDQSKFEYKMKQFQCMTMFYDTDLDCRRKGSIEKCAIHCGVTLE